MFILHTEHTFRTNKIYIHNVHFVIAICITAFLNGLSTLHLLSFLTSFYIQKLLTPQSVFYKHKLHSVITLHYGLAQCPYCFTFTTRLSSVLDENSNKYSTVSPLK